MTYLPYNTVVAFGALAVALWLWLAIPAAFRRSKVLTRTWPTLAFLGLVISAAGAVSLLGPGALLDEALWRWIERATWILALILFPVAIYQLILLRRDQERIAAEVESGPHLRIAFDFPRGEPELELHVAPHWEEGEHNSRPEAIDLTWHNDGNRTAHNVMINLVFPTVLVQPQATLFAYRAAPDGRPFTHERVEAINPGDYSTMRFPICFPRDVEEIGLLVTTSANDRPDWTQDLTIKIDQGNAEQGAVAEQGALFGNPVTGEDEPEPHT